VTEGKDVLHSRARAILAEDYDRPSDLPAAGDLVLQPLPALGRGNYEKILSTAAISMGCRWVQWHGGWNGRGSGRSPQPAQWITSPLRNAWLCDPLVLDSAFQMASPGAPISAGCVP
jgi:hypothetical protein